MKPNKARTDLLMDLGLVAFLIALDVVARLVPHAPGFVPIAASALFAGRVLRIPALAPVVPVAAMVLSALALGPDDWRVALDRHRGDFAAGLCRHRIAALARHSGDSRRHGGLLARLLRAFEFGVLGV